MKEQNEERDGFVRGGDLDDGEIKNRGVLQ
jgi:hypothetical protein